MLLTFTILVALIAINFALLFFSCNKTAPTNKPTKEKVKVLSTPNKEVTRQSKTPIYAATGS